MSNREYISPRMESVKVKAAHIDRQHERNGCNPLGMAINFVRWATASIVNPSASIDISPKTYAINSVAATQRVHISDQLHTMLCSAARSYENVSRIEVRTQGGKFTFLDENRNIIHDPRLYETLVDIFTRSGSEWHIEGAEVEVSPDLQSLLTEIAANKYSLRSVTVREDLNGNYTFFTDSGTPITIPRTVNNLLQVMCDQAIVQPQQIETHRENQANLDENSLSVLETSRRES